MFGFSSRLALLIRKPSGNPAVLLMRLDEDGNLLWDRGFGKVEGTVFHDLCLAVDGNTHTVSYVTGNPPVGDYTGSIQIFSVDQHTLLQVLPVYFQIADPPAPVLSFQPYSRGAPTTLRFSLTGVMGCSYVLEHSTNLLDWVPYQTNTLTRAPQSFSVQFGAGSAGFIRAVTAP